ncbi:MAG: hypothetical protein HY936_03585 [Nitrosomonadales bacterium]|nr:hypothetical protein [Nitrosomonadales bacterium]
MKPDHKRYVWLMVFCFFCSIVPILALNLFLVNGSLENRANTLLASQWQANTHGVVSPPSVLENAFFKLLRLNDRLSEINTVVLGSSTSYSIAQEMFPPEMRLYNFSKNANSLGNTIGEAEYLLDHAPNVKWFVMPIEWAVPPGYIYAEESIPILNLANIATNDKPPVEASKATWLQKIQDSLSYPRIAGLFQLLKSIYAAEQKYSAFRQIFLQSSSDEYICSDGTIAKDFDIQHRNTCTGFRFDGSWTYASHERVGNARALIMAATASNSKYTGNLLKTKGIPNSAFLRHLAAIARRAEERGGGAIFIVPPLLAGLENEFFQHPKLGVYLQKTKQDLARWAEQEQLTLLDAGQSERFGCKTEEFTDQHHATAACYNKVLSYFWQNAGGTNAIAGRKKLHATRK